jgi:hypothetical protein
MKDRLSWSSESSVKDRTISPSAERNPDPGLAPPATLLDPVARADDLAESLHRQASRAPTTLPNRFIGKGSRIPVEPAIVVVPKPAHRGREHRGRVYPRVPVTLCTSYACPTMSETLIQRFRNWHKLSVVAPVAYPARAPQRAWVLMNRGQAQARRG